MTAITVGQATATVLAANVQAKLAPKSVTKPSAQKGFFARAWEGFVRGRMRQAEREIALHRHLLPAQFQEVGDRLARSEKDLPFSR